MNKNSSCYSFQNFGHILFHKIEIHFINIIASHFFFVNELLRGDITK